MIPIRDNVPSEGIPWVVWIIVALNAAAFALELYLPEELVHALLYAYGLVPAVFIGYWNRTGELDYLPLFTSMFLHGSMLHIVSNVWSLLIFGDNVQERMGAFRFALFYLFCGLIASLCHLLANPESELPVVGASGAISGILGAYFVMYRFAKVETVVPVLIWPIFLEIPAFFFFGIWFLAQLITGTMTPAETTSVGSIAWWAHIGGFVTGVISHRLFLKHDPS